MLCARLVSSVAAPPSSPPSSLIFGGRCVAHAANAPPPNARPLDSMRVESAAPQRGTPVEKTTRQNKQENDASPCTTKKNCPRVSARCVVSVPAFHESTPFFFHCPYFCSIFFFLNYTPPAPRPAGFPLRWPRASASTLRCARPPACLSVRLAVSNAPRGALAVEIRPLPSTPFPGTESDPANAGPPI